MRRRLRKALRSLVQRPKHRGVEHSGAHASFRLDRDNDGQRWELYPAQRAVRLVHLTDGLVHLLKRGAYDLTQRDGDGRYSALCGARVLPSTLTDSGSRDCRDCRDRTIPDQRRRSPRRTSPTFAALTPPRVFP